MIASGSCRIFNIHNQSFTIMIERIIRFSINNKFIVGLFVIALIGWGSYSLTQLPIDVTPDITNNQVQVIAYAPSLAVQEVESSLTAPIESAVSNIPHTIEMRSISRLGLSVITIVFRDDVDIYWARQQISERLKDAESNIPQGIADISLAPITTGLGEIYQYRLSVDKEHEGIYSPMDLRTLQDWTIRRLLLGTPGVADVNSFGGFVKQYEIAVNPDRMKSAGLSLSDIFTALENNNENTGSAYIEKDQSAYFIRGIGLVKKLGDIENIVVKNNESGMPILIRDVADVDYGSATRYGAFVSDTEEGVGGVIMMLKDANAKEVIKNVEQKIQTIQKTLPAGVKIEPYLNRADLVQRTINTVSHNLIEGALIVIFILVLFLGNFRAGFIVASVIPLAMLFAVSMMNLFGVSGNLMSLGAIDFGLIVDGAVIIVESVVTQIAAMRVKNKSTETISSHEMDETVFVSAKRMMSSATFGQIIIFIVYIPIMSLVGIEGKMFRPMAQVVAFALVGAAILSLTYVPVASALLLRGGGTRKMKVSDNLMKFIYLFFKPIVHFSLRHKLSVTVTAIAMFVGSLVIFNSLGGEFVPQLEEGDLAASVITLQGGSLSNTIEQVKCANGILRSQFPEVKHVVCKIGTGEIPSDPMPFETGDYVIILKDKSEWTSATTREELVNKMQKALEPLAGVKFEFQQPIQMRTNELMSGSKQDVAIKIFGDDLDALSEKGEEVKRLIADIPGVADINVEKVTGLAQVQVEYHRERLAQYGLNVSDVNRVLRTAFAGSKAGQVYDGEKRFSLMVRMGKDYRHSIDDIRYLTVPLPRGGQIPMEQLADVSVKEGPAQISRENTRRRITIGFNVRGGDVETIIGEVQKRIDARLQLPTGYYVSYGGQFENLQQAKSRLMIAVPIALLLIFVLLYFAFKSVKEALLIYTAVPMSVIGGILALWTRGMDFSISAGVGFIALFGIAVLNGIVLISEFNRLERDGVTNILQRVMRGIRTRLRPVMITATAASLGFFPMAISTSAGAEVQKPLATVVIGGLISATLLTLVVLPIFYIFFSLFSFRKIMKRVTPSAAIILLFLLGGLSGNVHAQRRISMEEAVGMATDSNLTVRSADYGVKVQQALVGTSIDLPKTEIAGEYGQINSYSKDNSLGVSQSFAFPTVYTNRRRLARANVKSSEWNKRAAMADVAADVRRVYNQIVFLNEHLSLLSYQDSLYARFAATAEVRYKSGDARKLEYMTARTQQSESANRVMETKRDIKIYVGRLQALLNSPEPVLPSVNKLLAMPYRSVPIDEVMTGNPTMRLMRQEVENAKIAQQLEGSRMLPDFRVGISSQTIRGTQDVDGAQRTFGSGNRFNSIQLGVSVPLFYSSSKAKVKAARMQAAKAQTDADNYAKGICRGYLSLMEELQKQRGIIDYYERQAVPEADMIISQSDYSYRQGEIAYSEYIVNVTKALDIKQNYIDAINNYNQTVISLQSAEGE
jgi:cobalt-zinc-cadmium resistance protein CzcA